MKQQTPKGLIALVMLLLAGSVAGMLWMSRPTEPKQMAVLSVDGTVLQEIDLGAVTQGYTFLVEEVPGETNLVEVKPGAIGVVEANCPDALCVGQGFSQGTGKPIVCLPHRMVIDFRENEGTLDGYTG